jgi:amino-acid N-acetyltransferase
MYKAEKACIGDVPQMQELVNSFAGKGQMLPRALSEMYENLRDYFVIRDGKKVIACAALHINWSDLAEIRSVAVSEEKQRHGVGALLMEACLEEARGLGIAKLFCLTYKPDFFQNLGFRLVDKMELPRKVWSECYQCPHFPDCDEVALVLDLKPK